MDQKNRTFLHFMCQNTSFHNITINSLSIDLHGEFTGNRANNS